MMITVHEYNFERWASFPIEVQNKEEYTKLQSMGVVQQKFMKKLVQDSTRLLTTMEITSFLKYDRDCVDYRETRTRDLWSPGSEGHGIFQGKSRSEMRGNTTKHMWRW